MENWNRWGSNSGDKWESWCWSGCKGKEELEKNKNCEKKIETIEICRDK
jgi:hypothetical protein